MGQVVVGWVEVRWGCRVGGGGWGMGGRVVVVVWGGWGW